MHITKISIKNFRSFGPEPQVLETQPGLNVIVGENNSGKSSLFSAVESALAQRAIDKSDHPFGELKEPSSISVEATFHPEERDWLVEKQFGRTLSAITEEKGKDFRGLIGRLGSELFSAMRTTVSAINQPDLALGPGKVAQNSIVYPWGVKNESHLDAVLLGMRSMGVRAYLESQRCNLNFGHDIPSHLHHLSEESFRRFADVRPRPEGRGVSEGAGIRESFDGTTTANFLFNLLAGDVTQRAKYERIKALFGEFFPGLTFAVPVFGGRPHIVFGRAGKQYDILQAKVGTGVLEVLTILANVEGRRRGILVVEEPGSHLHPHAQRALQRLIVKLSENNQVFVLTHSPEFVNWANLKGLFRVAVKEGVSKVFTVPKDLVGKDEAALVQALRDPRKHDLLFARAVGLVEGETERAFLEEVGPRAGKALDLNSVSLVDVGGEGHYIPFIRFLDALSIPVRCLRDKAPNGLHEKYKPLFRTPGAEFEDYMKAQGNGDLLDEAVRATGKSKARAGRYMGEKIALEKVPAIYLDFLTELEALAKA